MRFVRPKSIGVVNGRLHACSWKPNCVCSFDTDAEHRIAPLQMIGPWEVLRPKLVRIIQSQPRMRVVADEGPYLRVECTTLIMRFVDDLEFLADPQAGVIHVRSASRVGRSDLGVNRQRVELLRRLLTQA